MDKITSQKKGPKQLKYKTLEQAINSVIEDSDNDDELSHRTLNSNGLPTTVIPLIRTRTNNSTSSVFGLPPISSIPKLTDIIIEKKLGSGNFWRR